MSNVMRACGEALSFEPQMTDFYNQNSHAIGQVHEACMLMTYKLCENNAFKFQDGEASSCLKKQLDIAKSVIDKLKSENAELERRLKEAVVYMDCELDEDTNDYTECGECSTDSDDSDDTEYATEFMTIDGVEYVVLHDGMLLRRSDGMQYGQYCSRTGNVEIFEQCE